MSLSPVKRLILETMWMVEKPAKAAEIAKEVGLGFPSVMMHIIGLTRMGYVETPGKGHYAITEKGKRALGFPKLVEKGPRRFWHTYPSKSHSIFTLTSESP